MAVSQFVGRVQPLHADPAQRFGLPGARAVVHPRQFGERGAALEHQIGQGAAGQVGGRNAVADVAARLPESGGRVQPDPGGPVPRHGKHAAPPVCDRHFPGLRECRIEHTGEVIDGGLADGTVAVDTGGVAVRHGPAADRNTVIGGPLGVEESVREITEGLAALPTDCAP